MISSNFCIDNEIHVFSDASKFHRAKLDESSLDSREMSGPKQLQESFWITLGIVLANRP